MFSTISTTIAKVIISPLIGLMVLAGYPVGLPQASQENVGATNAIESPVALFETSLASSISSSATSMSLVSATTLDGSTLASSTYSFIIDEGTASQEFVIADCTGTVCTNMERGISAITGSTSVTALQFAHRRGASVKITDAPILIKLTRIANGIGTFPNIISYTSHPTFTATTNIVDKKYVDDTAFSGAGVIDATTAARGVVELATQAETSAGTANGSSGVLVIPNSTATSTYNSATAPLRVVVTKNDGLIDQNFLGLSAYTGSININSGTGNSNIASTSIISYAATTTAHNGNYTWTKPNNLRYIIIEATGGGGGGAGADSQASGGSGGGGGYVKKIIVASALGATESIVVGRGGPGGAAGNNAGTAGGNTTFGSFVTAGGGGAGSASGGSYAAGAGGTASGGDVNIPGGNGGTGGVFSPRTGRNGGGSVMGSGGNGAISGSTSSADATNGSGYGGGGGSGNGGTSSGSSSGGNGATGGIILTQIFY